MATSPSPIAGSYVRTAWAAGPQATAAPEEAELDIVEALLAEPLPPDLESLLGPKRMGENRWSECRCSRVHVPRPHRLLVHFMLPLSWGGVDIEENRVQLCPTAFLAVTDLIDLMQQVGPHPEAGRGPKINRRDYPLIARRLASRAFYLFARLNPTTWPGPLDLDVQEIWLAPSGGRATRTHHPVELMGELEGEADGELADWPSRAFP